MPTAQQIYDITQDLFLVDASTYGTPAFEEDRVIDWINKLRNEFFINTELFRSTTLREVAASTRLSSAFTGGSTTLNLDSVSNFNGAFLIGDEYGFHTGTSGTDLTGVTNVNKDYAIDTVIYPLVKLPEHISVIDLKVNGNLIVNPDFLEFENARYFKNKSGTITFTYSYIPSAITSISDDVKINDPYHFYLVHGLLKIWKQIEDESVDTSREQFEMAQIINQVVQKQNKGKRIKSTSFSRFRGNSTILNYEKI